MSKDTPTLGLPASWVNHESFSQKVTFPGMKQIVRKKQQTRLLVEDNNFREIFQYYCIMDEFHNYLSIVLDLSVRISYLLYNFYLKLTNALRHNFSLLEILFQLLNENFVHTFMTV